jgi:hypothetical protein
MIMCKQKIANKNTLPAIAIALLLASASYAVQKAKPAPPPYVSASVEFINRSGDNITSGESGAAYVDGARGISCYLYTTVNPGTGIFGDLILNISPPAKRTLWYNFSPIGDTGPSGIIVTNTVLLNIRGVNSVPVGSSQASSAQMGAGFLFAGSYATRNPGQYSTPVLIEHLDNNTWRVTADPSEADAGGESPGDIAQRESDGQWYSYHMPFQVIITIQ